MEFLTQILHSSLSYLIPSIILLGLLIFVHELGHFAVAKYFKVRVEVFSLGFWKKIYQFKRGDTTYCISLVPLGGYVKMYGDDPTAEIPESEKKHSFLHKPVGQRIAIVLAGPLMNLFFAAFVFLVIAFVGEDFAKPIVGDITPSSVAARVGFQSGDQIVSVDGETVKTWSDFQSYVEKRANEKIEIALQRESTEKEVLTVTPTLIDNPNVLSTERKVGWIEGLQATSSASLVAVSSPDSVLGKAGLPVLSLLEKINGRDVRFLRHLPQIVFEEIKAKNSLELSLRELSENLDFKDSKKISIGSDVVNQILSAKIAADPSWQLSSSNALELLGIEPSSLYISSVQPGSPAEKAGLKRGDRLVSIGGKTLTEWEQVIELVKTYDPSGTPLQIEIRRNGEVMAFSLIPKLTELMTVQGKEERRYAIGVKPALMSAFPDPVVVSANSLGEGLAKAWKDTVQGTQLVSVMFLRLIQNEVSSKNIGGILSIGEVAGKSFQEGISQFLKMMAILSINLFLINLLPVPILDGGHLVFFSIEALRGAPLSMRKMEIAQQVGLIILMSLMLYAFFNDVTRFLSW